MQFPNYIPEPIKQQAIHYLEGSDSWEGWMICLKEQKEKLFNIDEKIAYWKLSKQDPDYADYQLEKLRTEKLEDEQHLADLDRDINCINRLIHDTSMKETYRLLINEFFGDETTDRKIDQFIFFAWSANINYAKPRESVNNAMELSKEISATATKLSKLLNKIGETGSNNPDEFFSIPSLLDSTDKRGHDFHIWKSMKNVVLGNHSVREQQPIDDITQVRFLINIISAENPPQIDPIEASRNALRYGWEKAPFLPELLITVARLADEFKPSCGYFADAAIMSQKRNPKTEYIRGYADLLRKGGFFLSPDILKAIAITATVVIDNPDLIVTYDDVRKALALTA